MATPDGVSPFNENNDLHRLTGHVGPIENNGYFSGLSKPDLTAGNENPGALAGATGADDIERAFKTQEYRTRHENARRLGDAIAECHPADACTLMEAALHDLLSERMPSAPFLGIMKSARFWAEWASVSELKAYCLASFERLSAADQSAFLAHVGGRMQ